MQDSNEGKPRYLNYVSTIEGIIGIGVIWAGFNLFFTDQIDYNTRYIIGGTLDLLDLHLIAFSVVDRIQSTCSNSHVQREMFTLEFLTIIAIAIIVAGSSFCKQAVLLMQRKLNSWDPILLNKLE